MTDIEGTGAQLRRRFRDLEPLLTDADPNNAYAEYVSLGPATPLGHRRQSFSSAAAITDIPAGAKKVEIRNLSEDVNLVFTDYPGDSPSSSLGFPIYPGEWLRYDNPPDPLLFFGDGGTVSVAFAFYA